MGGTFAKKNATRRARWPNSQIRTQSATDVPKEGKSILFGCFASDHYFSCGPVNVVEGHRHDFTCSQSQSSQKQENCVIALAPTRPPVRALEHLLYLVLVQISGNGRKAPACNTRYTGSEICRDVSPLAEKGKEAAECDGYSYRLTVAALVS